MKLISILCLLVLFSCASRTKVRNPYFFLAERDGQTMHILGTMHLGFKLEDFHPVVRDELDKADVVAVEADEDLLSKFQTEKARRYSDYRAREFLQPYPDLSKKLSPRAWQNLSYTLSMDEVQKILQRATIPVPPLKVNPALAIEITRDLINRHQMYAFSNDVINGWKNIDSNWIYFDSFNIVDREILDRARSNNQTVVALDSMDYDLIKDLTDFERNSLRFLEVYYGDSKSNGMKYTRLREDYREGRELSKDELDQMGVTKSVLYDRNEQWAVRLSGQTKKKIFVAVGALHVNGEKNVLSFLEKKGFKITRINLSEKP